MSPDAAAISRWPSDDAATDTQSRAMSVSRAVQVAPPSVEMWTNPPTSTAASRVPSAEDARPIHDLAESVARACQVWPRSTEV